MSKWALNKLVVIDPGMGNLRSVCRAWETVGASVQLMAKPLDLDEADALIFPGQGGMPHCMDVLRKTGWDRALKEWISANRPFFGICLGLQALFEYSEEGNMPALGLFPGQVRRFRLGSEYKIPHMGWNAANFVQADALLSKGLKLRGEQFYFVHSYHVETPDRNLVWLETEYGYPFVSGIRHGNCFATQFHPEKSQGKGLQIYSNFMEWLNK